MRTTSYLAVLSGLACAAPAQQVLLPDNHHLCENVSQLGNVGSTTWWRTTAGRFQVLYEASHFLNAGVTGPIMLTHLRFRGEDGEHNSGGQVYTGVTVEVGSTSLNTTTMNTTTFATNRAPVLPDTTTLGALGTTNVTIAPSSGSVPNNWFVDIDLVAIGASIMFDPTGAEPNLLVDISLPTAPANAAPLAMVATQDTTGGVTAVRGRGITTATVAATTGTASTAPPVIGVEFVGAGGHVNLDPARNEFYGAACGGQASTFYQTFLNGQQWDLGAGLTLTPDNATTPTYYTVTAGAPAPDLTQVNAAPNSTADDALVTHTLGFTFAFPGGSTGTIKPCTNGFIWLDPAMTATSFTAVVTDFLGAGATAYTARLSPYWHDFNCGRNTGLNPQSGLHVLTDATGGPGNNVCYVTWWDIGEFNSVSGTGIFGHAVWTFQCVMYEATGVVEYRYGTMPAFASSSTTTANSNPALVGFSLGRIGAVPSVNPQSRDLSHEVPFATTVEGLNGNMGLTAVATPVAGGPQYAGRMFAGQTLTWNTSNVPNTSLIGVLLLDIAATQPGFQAPMITAPGCILSTSTGALLYEITYFPPANVVGAVPLAISAGAEGKVIYSQYVVLDGLFGAPDLITVASNALKQTLGFN